MTRRFGIDPFVNYVRNPERESPINTAVARVVLGSYLVWKVLSLNWAAIEAWPAPVRYPVEPFLFPRVTIPLLGVEQWVLVAVLLAFTVGYRTRFASFVSALLITHMAGIRLSYNASGGTEALFLATYFLLLFGLYSDQDLLSVDAVRRTANASRTRLSRFLRGDGRRTYRMNALRLSVLTLGILYFGAGLSKIVRNPGLSWTAPDSLARYMAFNSYADHTYRPVAEFLFTEPLLLTASTWGTLALELGLLVAAIVGLSITPFVLGLVGLHVVIALTVGPFFFDYIVFLSLFAAYDSALSRLTWDRPIDVLYDDQSRRCMRGLSLFRLLDTNRVLSFHPHSDAPGGYRDRLDPEVIGKLYVFVNDEGYSGYRAFRELLARSRLFAPLALVMGSQPVESIGKRAFRYVVTEKSRRLTGDATDRE